MLVLPAAADGPLMISPIGSSAAPPAPWHVVGLPRQTKPFSRFTVGEVDGRRALRIESDHAYGLPVHGLSGVDAGTLTWRWRVDQPIHGADLRHRAGDDAALKVCAMFALPDETVPFVERQLLRLFEARAGEQSATVPPLQGIAIGADNDNTGSHSLARLDALVLRTP